MSFGLWLWESFGQSVIHAGEFAMVGIVAFGSGLWWLQQQRKTVLPLAAPDREAVETAIAQTQTILTQVTTEAPNQDTSALQQQLANLPQRLERQQLQIALAGGSQVGKTTLKQVLEKQEQTLTFVETALSAAEDNENAQQVALSADVVLFLVSGDLTDSQWQILQQLQAANSRLMLVFNQQDRYTPEAKAEILQQLRQRVAGVLSKEDVVAIAAAPAAVKVRRHQDDGSVQEWLEAQDAAVAALSDRLTHICTQEKQELICTTAWREAVSLKTKAKALLNGVRRDRALPVVEQYQWVAAAAAFANPVAALDLLATAAISTQMLVDLSEIYQQKFSLSQAQAASGTIGKLMVQLGLVEISTQTISGILKSNAFTYVAGGAVQGVSAAYLTRVAGLSLIEYLQEQEVSAASGEGLNIERLSQKIQQVFQQNQRTAFLQGFVKQALGRLSLKSAKAESSV